MAFCGLSRRDPERVSGTDKSEKKGGISTEKALVNTETGEAFHVGDAVELVSKDGEFNSDMWLGMTGTVRGFGSDWKGKEWVGVEWDIQEGPGIFTDFHILNGEIKDCRGYYVYPNQLSHVNDPAEFPDETDLADFLEGIV